MNGNERTMTADPRYREFCRHTPAIRDGREAGSADYNILFRATNRHISVRVRQISLEETIISQVLIALVALPLFAALFGRLHSRRNIVTPLKEPIQRSRSNGV